jgi:UDP-N-acetylglucosamine 3-dehydrogenase
MRLKIAVIGVGSMGVNHLRILTNFDEERVQLVGIADPREPVLKCAMKRFHVAAYSDYRQMIEQTRPDLVAIVVPTQLHYEIAAFALEHGINVFIEKPIATTPEEATILLDLARQSGVKIAVGHIERFNPAVVELKRRLRTNPPGQIFHLHARRIGPFPPRIRDVGVTLDLASHDIDVMRYLANSEVEHVYAQTQQRIHSTHEDLLLGILRFGNGAIGMLDVNWLTPTKVRELTVTCEKGMFAINYLTQEICFYENDYTPTNWDALRSFAGVSEGTMTRLKVQKAEPLLLEYIDVIKAITDDTLPTVTGEDGLAVLQVVQQLCAFVAPQDTRVRETVKGSEVEV